jgi:hypothetical protein
MAGSASTLSRRLSEVVGVALFASALIWLIALASYDPNDPVWFFSSGTHEVPANFVGRVGAFLAELSFQLFGYGSYLLPAVIAIAGWHYFWCREIDAIYTKLTGAVLALASTSAFMSLSLGSVEVGRRAFRGGVPEPGRLPDRRPHTCLRCRHPCHARLVWPVVRADVQGATVAGRSGVAIVPAVERGAAQREATPRRHRKTRQEGNRVVRGAEGGDRTGSET